MYFLSAYTNYIDLTLTTTSNCAFYFSKYSFNLLTVICMDSGATRYYGENYPRLQKLKEMWDPHSAMGNFPSGVEPKVSRTLSFFDQITIF